MVSPVQRWETRVIHLNLGGPSPAKPKGQPAKPPESDPARDAADQKPIFSESYLKEEFPNHYPAKQPDQPPAPQHPATQLQNFMNKLGQEGWEFVGVFPIGQLTMLFFRRPLPLDAGGDDAVSAPATAAAPAPQGSLPSPPVAPAAPASASQDAVLLQILQRLEALEGRQLRSQAAASTPVNEPVILSAQQRQDLASIPMLSTAEAATALGLRSPASLLNFGARHGYPLGLVKSSGQGLAAVFCGTQARASGGKAVRLWQVLPESALPSS